MFSFYLRAIQENEAFQTIHLGGVLKEGLYLYATICDILAFQK